MLVFPIENKPDWRHPPVATIAIILLNLMVFTLYQSGDREKIVQASRYYAEQALFEREEAIAREYFDTYAQAVSRRLQRAEGSPVYRAELFSAVFFHPGFDAFLRDSWRSGGVVVVPQWRDARRELEQRRAEISSYRFGFVPAEFRLLNFFSYAFLHGSWAHILGNMAFLFLFGFILERALGAWLYFALYSITAFASSVAFYGINHQSYVPLVGASGAVSGLMGACIIFYGLRKIRFFYTLGFYFGEFRAPALAIFPLWLAKEVYGFFWANDQVAYLAHLGGLLSGAGLMFFVKRSGLSSTDGHHQEKAPSEVDAELQYQLNLIASYNSNLDVDKALLTCKQALKKYPYSLEVQEIFFNTAKLRTKSKSFHQHIFAILKPIAKNPDKHNMVFAAEVIEEYRQRVAKPLALQQVPLIGQLSQALFRFEREVLACELLDICLSSEGDKTKLRGALQLALDYQRKRRNRELAFSYEKHLAALKSPGQS